MKDFNSRWEPYAVYLPAFSTAFTDNINKKRKTGSFPAGFNQSDLDYYNPKSKLWHYKWGLYSYGQAPNGPTDSTVGNRDRVNTVLLGDSGGFQIGCGSLPGSEHLSQAAKQGQAAVIDAWRGSYELRNKILNWLDLYCDYSMTIDMPLWANERPQSPFHKCTPAQLIALTQENLQEHAERGAKRTKWLNIVQSNRQNDWKQTLAWWDAVKDFRNPKEGWGGWALGGIAHTEGGLTRLMRIVLTMRDDGAFDAGRDWLHVLGVSQVSWAVWCSALQQGLRETANPALRVSYDSSSPFIAGMRDRKLALYPRFGKDRDSLSIPVVPAPLSTSYHNSTLYLPFASPVGDVLQLQHLSVHEQKIRRSANDIVSTLLITNHNVWVYLRAFLEANDIVSLPRKESVNMFPPDVLEVCDAIKALLRLPKKKWVKALDGYSKLFLAADTSAKRVGESEERERL